MQKPLFTSFLIAIFSFTTIASALSTGFVDTQNHWSKNYINTLKDQCGVNGYLDKYGQALGEFHPDSPITRAELVKIIFQCSKTDLSSSTSKTLKDLPANAWFTPYINWAVSKGLVEGYSDNTFRPNNYINRAEALKIITLAKFPANQITGGTSKFADISNSAWFAKYVGFALSHNYISGYPDGLFRPANQLTRAEAAKIIVLTFGLTTTGTPVQNPTQNNPSENNPVVSGLSPVIAGCSIFPADNPWNQDISKLAIDPNSNNYIASIGLTKTLHPDFGSPAEYGIPFVIVDGNNTQKVQVNAEYADESDFGLAPIPANPPIEGTSSSQGDRHVIVLDKAACVLYETWNSYFDGTVWNVGAAAKFDLSSNVLRSNGWTSADAAGLPVLPGLIRLDEVKSGQINHAIRFTANKTQRAYIHPATHFASSSTDSNLPPMGLRLRLKANFDTSSFNRDSQVILEAMKKYGLILADNGSDWFISGESNSGWNDEYLNQLKTVPGSAFEVVTTGPILK